MSLTPKSRCWSGTAKMKQKETSLKNVDSANHSSDQLVNKCSREPEKDLDFQKFEDSTAFFSSQVEVGNCSPNKENNPIRLGSVKSDPLLSLGENTPKSQDSKNVSFSSVRITSNGTSSPEETEAPSSTNDLHQKDPRQSTSHSDNITNNKSISHTNTKNVNYSNNQINSLKNTYLRESTDDNNSKTNLPARLPQNIEGLQWMNNLSSFDTPCVSYLDLSQDRSEHSQKQPRLKTKQRRSRIAANFNFF